MNHFAGKRLPALICALAMALTLLAGCSGGEEPAAAEPQEQPAQTPEQTQPQAPQEEAAQPGQISFDDLTFTPWDVSAAVQQAGEQAHKPYTILLYINGADLESESGMATGDLQEAIDSQFDEDAINVVVFAGGTAQWQSETIDSDSCGLYRIVDGAIEPIADAGLCSIGDPGTLAGFVDFGMTAFPADRYGLILWNHGGGSIAGYGVDEHFDSDALTLRELKYALEQSKAKENKFEFLGFDACLMATVETAAIAQDYANYLIASEELEPGYGWDYNWLRELGENPDMTGAQIGPIVVDLYNAFYEESGEDATLSVTDLAKVDGVLSAMGGLMAVCNEDFSPAAFGELSKSRNKTKTFGGGSPRDNDCDMIDIADMARQLERSYPEESAALIAAVEDAVVYCKNSAGVENAYGLTTYYPFGGKEQAAEAVEVYKALALDADYTNYLANFASVLTGENIAQIDVADEAPQKDGEGDYTIKLTSEELENLLEISFTVWEPVEGENDCYYMLGETSDVQIGDDGTIATEFDGQWPGINGDFVCLYEISGAQGSRKFAIPARLNGEDVDLIAVYDAKSPEGRILGARPVEEDTDMASRNLLPVKKGDRLQFLYYAQYFGDDPSKESESWYEGEEFVVDALRLETLSVNAGETYLYGFLLRDIQDNEYYTDFVEVEF